jgi:hypothetical protein
MEWGIKPRRVGLTDANILGSVASFSHTRQLKRSSVSACAYFVSRDHLFSMKCFMSGSGRIDGGTWC